MRTILVSGSLAYDHIMVFPGMFRDHLLPDQLHAISVSFVVEEVRRTFGGTGGNIAYTLALLGRRVEVLSLLGGDGQAYRERLRSQGIGVDRIMVESERQTATSYIMTDRENNQIAAFHPGASALVYDGDLPKSGDICGIISPSNPSDMLSFARAYRDSGVPFFVDPGQQLTNLSAEELRECVSGAEVLFANEYEAELVRERTGWSDDTLQEQVGAFVITKGAAGTELLIRGTRTHIEAVPVKELRDPTGAGDAYRAGFVAAHCAGASLEEAVKVGSATAVYAVEWVGTQEHSFSMEEVGERYATCYGTAMPDLSR